MWLKIVYKAKVGRKLNLKNPQTFSEKLNWLKIHDHNPRYVKMVDKYDAKEYVKDIIGISEFTCYHSKWKDEYDDVSEDFYFIPKRLEHQIRNQSRGQVID